MNRFVYTASLTLTLAAIITASIFLFPTGACSQNPEWMVFNTDNSGLPHNYVKSPAADSQGNIWIGTWGEGLAKFDGERWSVYDRDNSELPDDGVHALVEDSQGNIWIGAEGGLARFDGKKWRVYNTDNSRLPTNRIQTLAIDGSGNIWIGTYEVWMVDPGMVVPEWGGLVKFDGENWIVYDSENSELPHNYIRSLATDPRRNIWIGTIRGLARFDGEKWTVYNADNSDLPNNIVNALAEDPQGNIWIGTNGGLTKFDGENWIVYHAWDSELPDDAISSLTIDLQGDLWIGTWSDGLARFDGEGWTVYNERNSGLPHNSVRSLAIDSKGNLWIGTWGGGLGVYREGGVMLPGAITAVGEEFHTKPPSVFSLAQNYPNPFNPSTTISFTVPEMCRGAHVELTIYDLLGRKLRTLMDAHVEAGGMEVTWDGKDGVGWDVSSGVYFYRLTVGGEKWTETRKMVLIR